MNIGDHNIDDVLTFYANTTRFDTGAATDADSVPSYRVYEEETATPILTGTMALLDSTNTAGFYSEQITLSAANGFEVGKCYAIYIAATVNSVAGASHRSFKVKAVPPTAVAIRQEMDSNSTQLAAIVADTNELQTDDIPGTLATIAGYLDTEIAAILADTNELQTDWADGGRLDLILDARASQTSVNTVDTVADAIKVKTDQLTFGVTNTLNTNITHVNEIAVTGAGTEADPWGP